MSEPTSLSRIELENLKETTVTHILATATVFVMSFIPLFYTSLAKGKGNCGTFNGIFGLASFAFVAAGIVLYFKIRRYFQLYTLIQERRDKDEINAALVPGAAGGHMNNCCCCECSDKTTGFAVFFTSLYVFSLFMTHAFLCSSWWSDLASYF